MKLAETVLRGTPSTITDAWFVASANPTLNVSYPTDAIAMLP